MDNVPMQYFHTRRTQLAFRSIYIEEKNRDFETYLISFMKNFALYASLSLAGISLCVLISIDLNSKYKIGIWHRR